MTGDEGVINWLKAWAQAIRENELDKGRALFADDASGFGTITFITHSLDELVERQWANVWSSTKEFDFDWTLIRIRLSPDELQAVIHSPWTSVGTDEKGGDRHRKGRATIVLLRDNAAASWKCVHTHVSMWPNGADTQLMN